MTLVESIMLPLGTQAPNFSLRDVNNKSVSLNEFKEKAAYLIVFMCVHCPYVKHLEKEFALMANEYQKKGVAVIAINSNDADYDPDDGVEGMKDQINRLGFKFPYLIDETQEVAKAYKAMCTPDFYLFDKEKKLVYRGQYDKTRPGMGQPDGKDLKAALEAVIKNRPVNEDQKPSSGCNVKWKIGNEPEYFG